MWIGVSMKRTILAFMLTLAVLPAYSQPHKPSDAVIRASKEASKCRKILEEIEAPYKKVKVHTPEEVAYHTMMVEQQQAMIDNAEAALELLLGEDEDYGDASGEGMSVTRRAFDFPAHYIGIGGTKQ